MKILLLTDRMDAGGVETHIAELALGLSALGEEVAILSGGGRLADELERRGIKQHRVGLPTHSPLRLFQIRRQLLHLIRREGYTLLHAHARVPALLLRGLGRRGVATVVSVHAAFRVTPLLSRLCHWGNRTIAISEDLRAYVCRNYRIASERVEVIPNGIDTQRFRTEGTHVQTKTDAELPSVRVLFASRLDRDCSHGAELLCDLMPSLGLRHPSLSITLAGGGECLGMLRRRAEEVNRALGREAIRVIGWAEDMPALMRSHEIFVGVSRAAMEAAASGCAVILCGNEGYGGILSRRSAIAASLSNFCARGCPPPSAERLEKDLEMLLCAPVERMRLGAECRAFIRESFDAEEVCRRTREVYLRAIRLPPRAHVTVCGYFGCGNLGDDAILSGLLHGMHSVAPALSVTVLSGSPRRDAARFGIRTCSRRTPLSILLSLLRSDALLLGGGSLLQNATSNRSLLYYLTLIRLARILHRDVFFVGAGIGPLLGERACLRVCNLLNRCRSVGLRDPDSARRLQALGVSPDRLRESGDPALLSPPPPFTRAAFLLQQHRISQGCGLFAIVLHGGRNARSLTPLLLTAIRTLCQRRGLSPVLLLFDPRSDASVTYAAASALSAPILTPSDPDDARAILSVCRGLFTLRLHAMILAAALGTPSLGIPADPRDEKISSFARAAGARYLAQDGVSVPLLVEQLGEMLDESASIRPILCDAVSQMQKKATKDLANVAEMIYNNRQNKK